MPSCIVCQKDASSVCSLCKGAEGVMYCSQACQAKDWSIHKTKCPGRKKKQKPNSPPKPPPFVISEEDKQDAKFLPLVYYHPSQSPYGYSINPDTAIPSVFSSAAKHWISFSESSPRPVYERIADAFKYHITYTAPKFQSSNKDLGEVGPSLPMEKALPTFKVFIERAGRRKKLPDWWNDGHTAELLRLAEKDDSIRVDVPYPPEKHNNGTLSAHGMLTEGICLVPVEIEQSSVGRTPFLAPMHFDRDAAEDWMSRPTTMIQT